MKNNNYIYAALGLLALFMIVKNQRSETIEERSTEEKAGSDMEKDAAKPQDVKLDFQPQGFEIY